MKMIDRKFLNRLAKIIKILIVMAIVFVFILLLNDYFYPSGKKIIERRFNEKSELISDFEPIERVRKPGVDNPYLTVKGNIVYFNVYVPRWFETLEAELTFLEPKQPFIHLGARNKEEYSYLWKPLYLTSEFDESWDLVKKEKNYFFQRPKKFIITEEFLANLSQIKENILTNFYEIPRPKIITDYQASDQGLAINKTLRGKHTLFTYIKDEDLWFSLEKGDLNWQADDDVLNITIKDAANNKQINEVITIPDDGNRLADGQYSFGSPIVVEKKGLAEGVYLINLDCSDDVIIRNIRTKQHLLVARARIFPIDNQEYFKDIKTSSLATDLYTNSFLLYIKTSHENGFQTVKINNTEFELNALNRSFRLENFDQGLKNLKIPKNDVLIESTGYFSFMPESYFEPYPENIKTTLESTSLEDVSYIISQPLYQQKTDNLIRASQTFRYNELYIDRDNNLRVALNIPGLEEAQEELKINSVKITLKKPPLNITNFWLRLRNFVKNSF